MLSIKTYVDVPGLSSKFEDDILSVPVSDWSSENSLSNVPHKLHQHYNKLCVGIENLYPREWIHEVFLEELSGNCIHINWWILRNCMKIGLEYSFGYFALSKDTFGHTWTIQQV